MGETEEILQSQFRNDPPFSPAAMSGQEDLIDYEEDEVVLNVAPVAEVESAIKVPGVFGVHSTGFRDFLLKPELLRAISDLGFEHPSEGELRPAPCAVFAD